MGMTGPLSQKNLLAHPVLIFHCWKSNLAGCSLLAPLLLWQCSSPTVRSFGRLRTRRALSLIGITPWIVFDWVFFTFRLFSFSSTPSTTSARGLVAHLFSITGWIVFHWVFFTFRFFPFYSKPLATSTGDLFPHVISIIKRIFIHWIFFPFGITFFPSVPLVSSSEGLLAVLRRAVIIGGTAGICKRVQILWIFANLVCLFLNNTRSFASCIGCNTTLFPGCLIVGGGGRG